MSSVTEILDRASRLTGMRTTGTDRQIALDALSDVYMKSIMLVQHEQKIYRHTFRSNNIDYTIEKHNKKDFGSLGRNRIVTIGAFGTIELESAAIIAPTLQIRSLDLLTTYVNGLDLPPLPAHNFSVSDVEAAAGEFTNIDIPAGDYVVQYLMEDTGSLPVLRDGNIQIPPNLRIINAVYNDIGNSAYPLVHVSDSELLEYRRGYTTEGFARMYSVVGDGIIRLWPQPSIGDTVTFTYVPKPPILTEGECRPPALWDDGIWDVSVWDDARGTENVPSLVPDQFHYSVLLAGTVVQMLDRDQRMEQVQFWQSRYEAGIEEMMFWRHQYGGDPTPMFDRTRPESSNYPDQLNRRW